MKHNDHLYQGAIDKAKDFENDLANSQLVVFDWHTINNYKPSKFPIMVNFLFSFAYDFTNKYYDGIYGKIYLLEIINSDGIIGQSDSWSNEITNIANSIVIDVNVENTP